MPTIVATKPWACRGVFQERNDERCSNSTYDIIRSYTDHQQFCSIGCHRIQVVSVKIVPLDQRQQRTKEAELLELES